MSTKRIFAGDPRFRLSIHRPRVAVLGGVALFCLIAIILAALNFDALVVWARENAGDGRRQGPGYLVMAAFAVPGVLGFFFGFAALAGRFRITTAAGHRLKLAGNSRVAAGPGAVEQIRQDFGSGDPGRFMRWMKSTVREGGVLISVYRDVENGEGYVTLAVDKHRGEPLPVIALPAAAAEPLYSAHDAPA
ncbi:hypothetical protein [Gulosibacter sp. 10]|uniref:hypothetical protein n=1 Tax=Gulosibacter sp. 10 TaxID=1255570 RepID=UPI00097F6044|nr:hypothetical protein [Gulosibacter sp. 10]SJM71697.1 hypothetical protein FM112_16685 [Gulosibacter sp. 10]